MYWWLFRLNWASHQWEFCRSLSSVQSVAPCSNKVMSMTAFSSFCSLLLSVFVLFLLGSRKLLLSFYILFTFLPSFIFFFNTVCVCVCCGRYLDMLPTRFGNPLWFSDDDFLELKGTNLYDATLLQVKSFDKVSMWHFLLLHIIIIIIIILNMNSFPCLFRRRSCSHFTMTKWSPSSKSFFFWMAVLKGWLV